MKNYERNTSAIANIVNPLEKHLISDYKEKSLLLLTLLHPNPGRQFFHFYATKVLKFGRRKVRQTLLMRLLDFP